MLHWPVLAAPAELLLVRVLLGQVAHLAHLVQLVVVLVQVEGVRCRRLLVGLLVQVVVCGDCRRVVQGCGGRKVVIVALGREHGSLARVHLVLLLVFHAPILEPNLDLPLGQR